MKKCGFFKHPVIFTFNFKALKKFKFHFITFFAHSFSSKIISDVDQSNCASTNDSHIEEKQKYDKHTKLQRLEQIRQKLAMDQKEKEEMASFKPILEQLKKIGKGLEGKEEKDLSGVDLQGGFF